MSNADSFIPRKYLFITHARNFGGAERAITALANGLAEQGNDVSLIQYRFFDSDYPVSDSVKVIPLPQRDNNLPFLKRKLFKTLFIRKTVSELQPDFVIPMLGSVVDAAFLATRFKKGKFISTIRNNPAKSPDKFVSRVKRNIICLFSDAIFVQNNSQKEYFPKFMQKKAFAVPNAVFPAFFDKNVPEKDRLHRVISVGRYMPQKNQKLLVRAVAKIKDVLPDLTVDFYGIGSDDIIDSVKNESERLGVSHMIHCNDRVPDIENYLCESDIFVLPSDFEGMPNALMEAMAVGLPCISTDCPTGPSDLIKNYENGILIAVNDADTLAESILFYADNPHKAFEMGRKAKDFIKNNFSETAIAASFAENCERIF